MDQASIKHSAIAHYHPKEIHEAIDRIDNPILVCMTDTHLGFYHSEWFSKIRGAFDLRLIRQIECNPELREVRVSAIKQQKLRVYFTDDPTYHAFTEKLLDLRRSRMSPIRLEYQDMLANLNSRASAKLNMVNNLQIAEPFHPSLHFWKLQFLNEHDQIAEVKKQLFEQSEFFKTYASKHPIFFAEILSDIEFSHAEYLKLCSYYKLNLDSKDLWRLISCGTLAYRQGDGLTGALCFEAATTNARHKLSGGSLQDLLTEISYLQYRITLDFRTHWNKEGMDLITPPHNPENDREAIKDFATPPSLSVSGMEKDWFRGIRVYTHWTNSTDRCEAAWSALRSGDWKNAEKIVCEPGMDKWSKQYKSLPARDPRFFWSAIIACEILLKQGHKQKSLEIIDEASQRMLTVTEMSDSPWIEHSTVVSHFYRAIAKDDIDLAHLYLGQLPSDFQWGRTLIDHQFNDIPTEVTDLETTLGDFHQWISRTPIKESSQPILASIAEFNLALRDNHLRIVVGGETSAGKSTFINRLFGYPLLVVDRQESTAVPTHISYADNWGIQIDFKDGSSPRFHTWNDPKEGLEQIQRLVDEYGSLANKLSELVERIRITGPIALLSKGIELIDNPGLNAHSLRTAYAQQTLNTAHACLFIMDARNALKAGEMSAIEFGDEQLGRTIFILNKADLIQSDNEFDTDDNPLQSVLDHVTRELGQRSTSHRDVEVYAVSSLARDAHQDVFERLAERLQELAEKGRKSLLLYRAQRIAQEIAELSSRESMKEVIDCQKRTNDIRRKLPENPGSLRQFLKDNSLKLWKQNASRLTTQLHDCLNGARATAFQAIANNSTNTTSIDDLVTFLRNNLDSIIQEQITIVSHARQKALTKLNTLITSDLSEQLGQFYRDIEFDSDVNLDSLLSHLAPVPLPRSNGLFALIEKELSSVGGASVATAIPFAIVGTGLAGPIGGALGFAIGSSIGGANKRSSVKNKTMAELDHLIATRFFELEEVIDSDFISNDGSHPKALKRIFAEIDAQMDRFEEKVRDQKAQIEYELKQSEQYSQERIRLAKQAERWRRTLSADR